MSRNYPSMIQLINHYGRVESRDALARWADSHETHLAVATAIHAIAGADRSPEAIWEGPTAAEWDNVTMAVEEYVAQGDFAAEDDGRYPWGAEAIDLTIDQVL